MASRTAESLCKCKIRKSEYEPDISGLICLHKNKKVIKEKKGAGEQAKLIDKYIRYIYNVYTKGDTSHEKRKSRKNG